MFTRQTLSACLLPVALLVLPGALAAQNLVVNGGFEQPPPIPGSIDFVSSSVLGWQLTGTDLLLLGSGPNFPPSEGVQMAVLGSLDQPPARISQNIPTVAGGQYQLRFAFSPEPGQSDNQLRVSWNGPPLDTLAADGSALSTPDWQIHTYTVAATSSSTVLDFEDLGVANDHGDWLDAVSVTPITPLLTGTKQVDRAGVPAGRTVTYTVVLRNLGQQTQADNPGDEFVDVLPAGMTLQGATATSGTVTQDLPGNTVHWNGAIPGGGTVTITIQALVGALPVGTTLANQGTVSFDGDGNGSNESSTVTDDPATPAALDATRILVVPDPIAEVPTLSGWGLAAFALLLASVAWRISFHRR